MALPPGYRPAAHCYALSRVAALLLNRIGYPDVRCVVGTADARDWLHEFYPAANHSWLVAPGWRFDPKSAAARHAFGDKAPVYENYVEATDDAATRMREGFANACGVEEGVFDVVADACERMVVAAAQGEAA
jgi:hypothetical protein